MITEQELAAAIVTVEQCIRDGEEDKQKNKQDSARLKELSLQLLIDKTKLQVLHYAQGVVQMVSEEELQNLKRELEKRIGQIQGPVETNLFNAAVEGTKDQDREKCVLRTKLFALKFVTSDEKKIV